jgi:hypothetical protein
MFLAEYRVFATLRKEPATDIANNGIMFASNDERHAAASANDYGEM